MLDETTKMLLAKNIAKEFSGMGLMDWQNTHKAAWKIYNEIWPIRSIDPETVQLKALTHNMFRYCGLHKWQWLSGKGIPVWDKLLKDDGQAVQYDCYSMAAALAELAKLLGFGHGQGSRAKPQTLRSMSIAGESKRSPSRGILKGGAKNGEAHVNSSVYHLKQGESLIVLPLDHLANRGPLLMPGGEAGLPHCGGHHVWSDHRFVVINKHVYDAMLNIAGLPFGSLKQQFVEWLAEPMPGNDWRWFKPDRPHKPWIFIDDALGRMFKDKFEGEKKLTIGKPVQVGFK